MKDAIISKLHDFLLGEESVPFLDQGKVVTLVGGDAKIRAQAIRECIRRIEDERPSPKP